MSICKVQAWRTGDGTLFYELEAAEQHETHVVLKEQLTEWAIEYLPGFAENDIACIVDAMIKTLTRLQEIIEP